MVLYQQVWDTRGWLSARNVSPLLGSGVIDFAGGAIVHVVGGLCGLWGALIVGPRTGRFVDGVGTAFLGHNVTLIVLGWYVLPMGCISPSEGSCAIACGRHVCLTEGDGCLAAGCIFIRCL